MPTEPSAWLPPNDGGGWVGFLPYEWGERLEPAARVAAQCAGSPAPGVMVAARHEPPALREPRSDGYTLGAFDTGASRGAYVEGVRVVKDRIREGQVYQANLAHRLAAPFQGSARTLASALFASAEPRFGAYLEFDHADRRHAVVSLSPERLVRCNHATRALRAEPMKGTRPGGNDAARAASELRASAKDRAELDMITDLMRNDLGRVAAFGSVRVTEPRRIEHHAPHSAGGGVVQATSRIDATLRDGMSESDLLRAVFPGGSVTGAPKISAMRIIRELEREPRGVFCGSCVVRTPDGALDLNVGIRTAHLSGRADPNSRDGILDGELVYWAGAGIVVDSVPEHEWEETLVKARVITEHAEACTGSRSASVLNG